MSRNQITFIIGLILALIPFSGFPYHVKNAIYIIAGILLLAMSILSYLKYKHYFAPERLARKQQAASTASSEPSIQR